MGFTRPMAEAAPRLALVQVPGAGLDRIDRSVLRLTDSTVEAVGMTGLQIEGSSDATVRALPLSAI